MTVRSQEFSYEMTGVQRRERSVAEEGVKVTWGRTFQAGEQQVP